MQGWLPLFPLQVVLLPDAELPLHIFEDRYKEMIAEVLRDKIEFGVVLANEKGIVNTGLHGGDRARAARISGRAAGHSDGGAAAV